MTDGPLGDRRRYKIFPSGARIESIEPSMASRCSPSWESYVSATWYQCADEDLATMPSASGDLRTAGGCLQETSIPMWQRGRPGLKKQRLTSEKESTFICPQGPASLEERIALVLAGTEYKEHRWHRWRRGGVALLKWMGVPIDVGQWWGKWGSRRVVAEYMPTPLPRNSSSSGSAPCPSRSGTPRSRGRRSPLSICGQLPRNSALLLSTNGVFQSPTHDI